MITESITVGKDTEYPLSGILTLPEDAAGPVPAVVMVHGSGSSDMDERVMKLTPFKDLAEGLAEKGVASIRYEKRSWAYASKMSKMRITVKEETIDDALLAIEMLKNDERIDKDNIFILGHSQGAILAPRIDAEGGDVKGLVMLAGTPHRLEDIILRQLKQAGEKNGLLRLMVKFEYKMYSKKFIGLDEMDDETAKKKTFVGNLSLYYFKEMGRKSASDYLLESSKPAMLLQGEKDFQVLADDDFALFKEQLAGRENTVFRLYPGLNHCFVQSKYDNILKMTKEYGFERHIGEEVIGDIADFIHANSK